MVLLRNANYEFFKFLAEKGRFVGQVYILQKNAHKFEPKT